VAAVKQGQERGPSENMILLLERDRIMGEREAGALAVHHRRERDYFHRSGQSPDRGRHTTPPHASICAGELCRWHADGRLSTVRPMISQWTSRTAIGDGGGLRDSQHRAGLPIRWPARGPGGRPPSLKLRRASACVYRPKPWRRLEESPGSMELRCRVTPGG